jgi:hypothetical protein
LSNISRSNIAEPIFAEEAISDVEAPVAFRIALTTSRVAFGKVIEIEIIPMID